MAQGKIVIQAGANVWPHELKTAEALAKAGYTVEFIRKSEVEFQTSADCYIDGVLWEMKAPKSSKKKAIDRNLREAVIQSPCVVFDSRRMKQLPDRVIEQELRACAERYVRGLQHLRFVGRGGRVIDIK